MVFHQHTFYQHHGDLAAACWGMFFSNIHFSATFFTIIRKASPTILRQKFHYTLALNGYYSECPLSHPNAFDSGKQCCDKDFKRIQGDDGPEFKCESTVIPCSPTGLLIKKPFIKNHGLYLRYTLSINSCALAI